MAAREGIKKIVLLSCGSFNPVTNMHLRMFGKLIRTSCAVPFTAVIQSRGLDSLGSCNMSVFAQSSEFHSYRCNCVTYQSNKIIVISDYNKSLQVHSVLYLTCLVKLG